MPETFRHPALNPRAAEPMQGTKQDWALASCMPHRLAVAEDSIEFRPTDRQRLRQASFLDGRTDFSTGPSIVARLSTVLAAPTIASGPDRFIFHVAFCGSTLLSRLLDIPGSAIVLREPHCLVDIAVHRAALDREERSEGDFFAILRKTCALLRRPWQSGEPVVIKPSNWINNIAPDICADAGLVRPLFLTMTREAFVRAVVRGGSERLAFAARAAVHLTSRGRENAELLATALTRDTDQPGKLVGLAAVTHEVQMRLFREATSKSGWGDEHWLSMDDLLADPRAAALRAAAALSIELPEAAIEQACGHWIARHAKQPELGFSLAEQEANDGRVGAENEARIDAALRWADEAMGPA